MAHALSTALVETCPPSDVDVIWKRGQENDEAVVVDRAGGRTGDGLDMSELGRRVVTEERQTSRRIATVQSRSRQTGNFTDNLYA